MEVKLPNFLIVGAAKSGTTSLYHYLKQHPEVYMSPVKEPRFITAQFMKFPLTGIKSDKIEKNIVKNFDEYKKLFENVNSEKAIGEASNDNLYFYEEAIKCIKKYLGNVKIIIILRNPIDRAFSAYQMFLRSSREYLSFEDALRAEDGRKNKNLPFGWYYKSAGLYYRQVKAYLQNFTHVKVYFYDDLKDEILGLIKDMYEFLGVDKSFTPNISFKYNIGGVPKNKLIKIILISYRLKTAIKKILKFFLGEEKTLQLIESLRTRGLKKQSMKPETREYLKNFYREDIMQLQDLIKKDLSHWLR